MRNILAENNPIFQNNPKSFQNLFWRGRTTKIELCFAELEEICTVIRNWSLRLENGKLTVVKTSGHLLRRLQKFCCEYLGGFVEKIGKDFLSGLEEICFQDLKIFVERTWDLRMHKFYWKNLDRPPRRSQVFIANVIVLSVLLLQLTISCIKVYENWCRIMLFFLYWRLMMWLCVLSVKSTDPDLLFELNGVDAERCNQCPRPAYLSLQIDYFSCFCCCCLFFRCS